MYYSDYVSVEPFSEGIGQFGAAQKHEPKEQLYGFMKSNGTEIIGPTYYDAGSFSKGLAQVVLNPEGKWGCIDTSVHLVIPFRFDVLGAFSQWVGIRWNGKTSTISLPLYLVSFSI